MMTLMAMMMMTIVRCISPDVAFERIGVSCGASPSDPNWRTVPPSQAQTVRGRELKNGNMNIREPATITKVRDEVVFNRQRIIDGLKSTRNPKQSEV